VEIPQKTDTPLSKIAKREEDKIRKNVKSGQKKLHLPKKILDKSILRVYNITCLKKNRETAFRLRM
jgi:hypothetical protein